jgi:predicted ABC-type exoprotein transport system permease subunit
MTTITLKLKTKRDANQIFDFAKKSNIYMQVVANVSDKTDVKKPVLSVKERKYLDNLKQVAIEIKSGNFKGQSVKSFFNEL